MSIEKPYPGAKDGPGSGYASYIEIDNPKYSCVDVPLIRATKESLKGYGEAVYTFEPDSIEIRPWPVTGKRPLCSGTGQGGGFEAGTYSYRWLDDMMSIKNKHGEYRAVYGRLPPGVSPHNRSHVLVRELNYHPDCGQIFFPKHGDPFVGLFALPNDDIQPNDFKAFYFDGSFGIKIHPYIWHQPIFPVNEELIVEGSQGRVHACIGVDTIEEFGKWLKVPLNPELTEY